MNSQNDFFGKSMDEIVFENRNKSYGAFALRELYHKNMLKALAISVSIFIIGLYSPKAAKNLGLFADKQEEVLDTTIIKLVDPPPAKPDEPPPPPPPEEVIIERPTIKFLEMQAVEKEKATDEPPPTIEEITKTDIGTDNKEGDPNATPTIVDPDLTGGTGDKPDDRVYEVVDIPVEFEGGQDAQDEFLSSELKYPPAAEAEEITGTTLVYFVVNTDGRVVDVRVKRSSGNAELDAEAVRVVKRTSGKWKAAKLDGKSVRKACVIPIDFNLE